MPMIKYMSFNVWFSTLAILILTACTTEDFPEYVPQPVQRTKQLNLLFLDETDPGAQVLIYVDGKLVDKENFLEGGRTTSGFLQYDIPDSLTNRTFTITLAESDESTPSQQLKIENRIFETFLLPTEFETINTLVFNRKDVSSTIQVTRLGITHDEPAPASGYFKVRFVNLTQGKIDISRRDGTAMKEFVSLNILEERPFIELPFGDYRFFTSRTNGSLLYEIPTLLKGTAGKCFTVLCTNERQYIAVNANYGLPIESRGYISFVNLYSATERVELLPLANGERTYSVIKNFGFMSAPDMVKGGTNNLQVKVNEVELSVKIDVKHYEYLTVVLIEKSGKPTLEVLPTPMVESGSGNEAFCRFLNYSPGAGRVTFTQVIPTIEATEGNELAALISAPYASNLAFGEVRIKQLKNETNLPYVVYLPYPSAGLETAPLVIQANRVTDSPFIPGDAIAGTRHEYPFFFHPPRVHPLGYKGHLVGPGIYTVVLAGTPPTEYNEENKVQLIVLKHSF
jgi:hypothetical protein